MGATIRDGSIWWTIKPSFESEGYGETTTCQPQLVKAWRIDRSQGWRLSAFDADSGRIDDDSNCTRLFSDSDIGRTVFPDESSAWVALLGPMITPHVIASELEERALIMEQNAVSSDIGKQISAPFIAALREIARQLRST